MVTSDSFSILLSPITTRVPKYQKVKVVAGLQKVKRHTTVEVRKIHLDAFILITKSKKNSFRLRIRCRLSLKGVKIIVETFFVVVARLIFHIAFFLENLLGFSLLHIVGNRWDCKAMIMQIHRSVNYKILGLLMLPANEKGVREED